VSKTVPFDIESHTKYLIIYQRNQEIWKMYQNGADKQKIEDGIAPSCRANSSFIAKRYSGLAMVYVTPHRVFLANGFYTPTYPDKTKQISMVSVNYGNQITIGATLRFR